MTTSPTLVQAAADGDLATVRKLVEAGGDVNDSDCNGSGSLLSFHPPVVAYLLSQGASPNTQTNENGASVLAGLCYVDQFECVKLLLEHGADPNRGRQESSETPLHHALANDSTGCVELLIQHGADVNAQTTPGIRSYNFYGQTPTCGETPLHRAAAFATIEVVRLLLSSGADPSLRDEHGLLPYHWAGWHRRPRDLVELLNPPVKPQ